MQPIRHKLGGIEAGGYGVGAQQRRHVLGGRAGEVEADVGFEVRLRGDVLRDEEGAFVGVALCCM